MARQISNGGAMNLCGRRQTSDLQSWEATAPDRYYTRASWPPRGRGRGESLSSPRRIAAKLRAAKVLQLRTSGATWEAIARGLGFADASGAYRSYRRAMDRILWQEALKRKNKRK